MKSFKVRDGKMLVDGVYYSESPSDNVIMGKMGKIHSINISGKPIVKVSKKSKSELKESNGLPTDESGKLVKVKRTKKK